MLPLGEARSQVKGKVYDGTSYLEEPLLKRV